MEPNGTCFLEGAVDPRGCPPVFDNILCWPATPPDTLGVQPCMAHLDGVYYNTSNNATRWCFSNGSWAIQTNFSACSELPPNSADESSGALHTSTMYLLGYSISLVVLCLASGIFLYFKDLKCLRNTIHMNLMFSYIMSDFMWMMTLIIQTNYTACLILVIMLHYFYMTTFFWMFVEGLYLYMLVVETFSGENLTLRIYACIGWGGPLIFVIVWALVKSLNASPDMRPEGSVTMVFTHCPWMAPHSYDWIHQAPTVAVLVVNLFFLVRIMWVLITKLRSATSVETQQYRKASKALLVLIPLLGGTYILMIAGPTQKSIYKHIYEHLRAFVMSTQGFTVALFYCFMNSEVQNTLKHRLESWRTEQAIGSRRHRCSAHSKEYSPRSRTESIRLYSQPTGLYRKRESTSSEVTTTTLVNINGTRASNGSQARGGSPFLNAV